MTIYVAIYLISVLIQFAAGLVALSTVQFVRKYRFGWLLLALGFLLMVGRRITPLLKQEIIPLDAFLSLIISSLLFFGILTVRKITKDLKDKETKLQELLQFDFLTNAYSRSEILYRGHLEFERAIRSNLPLGLLVIDIDHFKKVNDEFGHQAGDLILKNLTKHCLESLREIDLIGRIGGEEFLILLPNTNLENSKAAAERIRKYVAQQSHYPNKESQIKITVSIGVACFNPNECISKDCAELLQSFIKLADQAMYQAKENGRNQTACLTAASLKREN